MRTAAESAFRRSNVTWDSCEVQIFLNGITYNGMMQIKSLQFIGKICVVHPPEVSTPLWCSKEGRKEKPARYCRCCLSPWRRCCHHFRGGWHRCWREAWAWSWRRRAAGASSCWFCALWPGDSGTRSSPGDEEKVFLPEPLLFTLKCRTETNVQMWLLGGVGGLLPVALIGWGLWPAPISSWWWCTCCSETPFPAPAAGGRCKPPGTCL